MRKFIKKNEITDEQLSEALTNPIAPCQVVRLTTLDGIGKAQGLKVGDTVWLNMKSVRQMEITEFSGIKHKQLVVDKVDANGKTLGWLYADFFTGSEMFEQSRKQKR